ncbi:MAG: hypothetical protein ACTSRU_21495 [Candidatus Hodarchaeales archaeon]
MTIDSIWDSSPLELPNGWYIIPRDIGRALKGEDFSYYPGVGKPIKVEAVQPFEFHHHMEIFSNYEEFGLPHGKGWLDERPCFLTFITDMKSYKTEILNWHNQKRA